MFLDESLSLIASVGQLFTMCPPQMRIVIFISWLLFYVSFLLVMRKMWTGKYVRSPLARSLFMNMETETETPGYEAQQVRGSFTWNSCCCGHIYQQEIMLFVP